MYVHHRLGDEGAHLVDDEDEDHLEGPMLEVDALLL